MPCLKIFTSLAKEKIPGDFASKLVPVLARTVRKSEEKFVVMVSTDCTVAFHGKPAATPGAVATLESIGNLGVEENKLITKEVTAFVQKELGVPPQFFFISFYDIPGQNIGKGGITFA